MKHKSSVWMVGTAPETKGGIGSLIQQYRKAGIFDSGAIHFEPTHHDRSPWGKIVPFLRCAIRLWGGLLMGQVALIHAHSSHGASFLRKSLLILPAIVVGVPAILHLHGSNFVNFHSQGGRWLRSWIRFIFRRSFRVIALSEEWRRWVLSVEPNAKVEVIFNSLPKQTGLRVSNTFGVRPTVLFLGRIGYRKGSYDLLRVFATVKVSLPQAKLVFAGDGDTDRLLAEAKTLHVIEAINCVGWVNDQDKARLISECWVLALPSYREGLPIAILEAMAFSRAVVSSAVGGIPQAVEHGRSGFLVRPGDVAGLAQSLLRILSDRGLAQQLGFAGRLAFEEKFSHDTALPRLLALYRRAGVARLPYLHCDVTSDGRHLSAQHIHV